MEKPIVMYGSDDAAHESVLTVDGKSQPCWVSRFGKVFTGYDAQHMARYDGCTHRVCDCGMMMTRHYTACERCREEHAIERYSKREKRKWDERSPIYSDAEDRYFSDFDEIEEYCDDNWTTMAALRLIICVPVMAREIDPNNYYDGDLPEDTDVPVEIADAFDAMNKAIRECKAPLSWNPSKFAVDLEDKPERQ